MDRPIIIELVLAVNGDLTSDGTIALMQLSENLSDQDAFKFVRVLNERFAKTRKSGRLK